MRDFMPVPISGCKYGLCFHNYQILTVFIFLWRCNQVYINFYCSRGLIYRSPLENERKQPIGPDSAYKRARSFNKWFRIHYGTRMRHHGHHRPVSLTNFRQSKLCSEAKPKALHNEAPPFPFVNVLRWITVIRGGL